MDTVAKAGFRISVLGPFALAGPGGPVDLNSKKLAALLAFLACTAPSRHSRDKLMTLLWGSHFEAQARQNLRQALTRLRRILGPDAFIVDGETVSLHADAIASDVAQFEALLRDGSREALNKAVGLYKERLLADIAIPEETWTEWLDVQRQRLEGLAADAMIKLGECELQSNNTEQALGPARRALEINNLREDAHRLVMRALAAGGRRADALKHYERVVDLLKRELEIGPEPATAELAAQIRKEGKPRQDLLSAPTGPPLSVPVPKFDAADPQPTTFLIVEALPGRREAISELHVGEVVESVTLNFSGNAVSGAEGAFKLKFPNPRLAVAAAFEIQRRLARQGAGDASKRIDVRMGAYAPEEGDDRQGVQRAENMAKRAAAGEILVSANLREALTDGIDASVDDLEAHRFEPTAPGDRAFRITAPPALADANGRAPAFSELEPAIAVIPFAAYGGGEDHQIVGEILADEIIGSLSQQRELAAISRLSTRVFRQREARVEAIGAHLRANYVLSGRYRVAGENVTLRIELAEVKSGRVVLAESLEDKVGAIVAGVDGLVDQLVASVTAALLDHALRRVQSHPFSTLENHTLMLASLNLMNGFSPDRLRRAHELLTVLAERCPSHPLPYANLAHLHVRRAMQGWTNDPNVEAKAALDCTSRALDIDPNCSPALIAKGNVHSQLLKQLDTGAEFLDRALAINPNDSLAWLTKGALHAFRGEGEQALPAAERALRLSPLDPKGSIYRTLAGMAANAAGRYERAIELAKASLRLDRYFGATYRVLAIAQHLSGRTAEARETVSALLQVEPELTVSGFLKRHPSGDYPIGQVWAGALRAAGVPQ